jgi:hypothetical protein
MLHIKTGCLEQSTLAVGRYESWFMGHCEFSFTVWDIVIGRAITVLDCRLCSAAAQTACQMILQ